MELTDDQWEAAVKAVMEEPVVSQVTGFNRCDAECLVSAVIDAAKAVES